MISTESTVKRTYDQYEQKDYDNQTTNLNPQREMSLDKLDLMQRKIQEITDDIIRKKIVQKKEPEPSHEGIITGDAGLEPGAIPLQKQEAIYATGGNLKDSSIFPGIIKDTSLSGPLERIIALFPDDNMLSLLDQPPQIYCDDVLSIFDANELAGEEPEDDEDGEGGDGDGGGDDNDEDDELNQDNNEEESLEDKIAREKAKCQLKELDILKILLIIVKVIAVLKRIIKFIIGLLNPIIQIVQWAAGVWINPPSMALIIQYIVEQIISLIVMIITQIIHLIWNQLNLDCITDMTQQLLNQIKQAFSQVLSMVNKFDPKVVSLLASEIKKGVTDPLQKALDEIKKKNEGWKQFIDDCKALTDPEHAQEVIAGMEADITKGVKKGVTNLPEVKKTQKIVQTAKDISDKKKQLLKTVQKKNEEFKKDTSPGGSAKMNAVEKQLNEMFKAPNIVGLTVTKKG